MIRLKGRNERRARLVMFVFVLCSRLVRLLVSRLSRNALFARDDATDRPMSRMSVRPSVLQSVADNCYFLFFLMSGIYFD